MRVQQLHAVFPQSSLVNRLFGVIVFTVALVLSAFIKIPLPFTPVPVTLQNLVVFLSAAILGPVLGMLVVGLYILFGIFGAPLFANYGAGIFYIFGPTGGYLVGFIVSACFTGYVLSKKSVSSRFLFLSAVLFISALIIYFFGGMWLAIGFGWNLNKILFFGVAPFILPDLLKVFMASVLIKSFRR